MSQTDAERIERLTKAKAKATGGEWHNDKGMIRSSLGGSPILRTKTVTWCGVDGYQPRQALDDGDVACLAVNELDFLLTLAAESLQSRERLAMEKLHFQNRIARWSPAHPPQKKYELLAKEGDECGDFYDTFTAALDAAIAEEREAKPTVNPVGVLVVAP